MIEKHGYLVQSCALSSQDPQLPLQCHDDRIVDLGPTHLLAIGDHFLVARTLLGTHTSHSRSFAWIGWSVKLCDSTT
jgi:hypothetical protein